MSKAKTVVTNTSSEVRRDPLTTFVKAVMPNGIEAMEKQGQVEFVTSDILPTEIQDPWVNDNVKGSGRKILEAWGFTFGKVVGGDTIFTQAKLPPGWTKRGSDHDMWSHILDEQGRERCSIFYKAAFYDRSAHMGISNRYRTDIEYEDEKLRQGGRSRGLAKEGTRVIFTGEWHSNPTEGTDHERKYGAYEAAQKDAREWFKANIPADLTEQWSKPCPV
jgi:hypothetical protein